MAAGGGRAAAVAIVLAATPAASGIGGWVVFDPVAYAKAFFAGAAAPIDATLRSASDPAAP